MNNIYLRYLAVVLIFIATQSFLNGTYFSYSKKIARLELQKRIEKRHNAIINETDSTLRFSTVDTVKRPYSQILYFNAKGHCYKQTEMYYCDSCLKNRMSYFFSRKRLHWIKISDKKFMANKKFIFEIVSNGTEFSYTITKQKMSKKDFNELIKEKQ